MLELKFLGSGNAFAQDGRYWSGFIANDRYIFDAPPTLLPHLKRLGVPLPEIEAVFISHLHGDHFAGLPFLLLEYVYLTERRRELTIVGPPGIEDAIESFVERCYPGLVAKEGYRTQYIEAAPPKEQKAAGIGFRAFEMKHGSEQVQALGYRVTIDGVTLAYTGDAMVSEHLFQLARGADALVADCTYAGDSGPEHMGIEDIRLVRERIPDQAPIVLTHLGGEPDISGMKNVILAQDFGSYRFEALSRD